MEFHWEVEYLGAISMFKLEQYEETLSLLCEKVVICVFVQLENLKFGRIWGIDREHIWYFLWALKHN